MSPLVIFKNTYVHALRDSIRVNLTNYLRDESWLETRSPNNSREILTGFEPAEPMSLELPKNEQLKDIDNAIRLHRALINLTPLQARDPRLWTRLCHVDFWQYMRMRWPVNKHVSNPNRADRFIESRYFIPQNQSRALLRNGIARLWWIAQLSYDHERENHYELTQILLSMLDITQQILERGMGRASNIVRGFLEFLQRNSATLLIGGDKNRHRIRHLAKYLNMYGGVCILDCLSNAEITELLDSELMRILKREAEEKVEPTNI